MLVAAIFFVNSHALFRWGDKDVCHLVMYVKQLQQRQQDATLIV
jgi:hypothetical protein